MQKLAKNFRKTHGFAYKSFSSFATSPHHILLLSSSSSRKHWPRINSPKASSQPSLFSVHHVSSLNSRITNSPFHYILLSCLTSVVMAKSIVVAIVVVLCIAIAVLVCTHFQKQEDQKKSRHRGFVFNATVSLSKPGAYIKIMDAIAAAPVDSQSRYYIHLEAGVYLETVQVWKNKTNIALIGDGAEITRITMNRKFPDFETHDTATVSIEGNGFMAQFITFENSAGEDTQAVALMTLSNHSSFYRCIILGYQDTLYARFGVQFYRECDIYGTVDIVFGDATAVFQACNLYARSANRVITFTAEGKQTTIRSGFVIHNSSFTTAAELESNKSLVHAYLGRPWFPLSTVIVMQSFLDIIVDQAGWIEWPGKPTNKLTYLEYDNWGPGAATERRVAWKGYKVLNKSEEVMQFTVAQHISGDSWIPETGIPYTSALI